MKSIEEAIRKASNALSDYEAFLIATTGYTVPFQHERAADYYLKELLSKRMALGTKVFDWADDRKHFPVKPHVQALVKSNLFLKDVVLGSGKFRVVLEGILSNVVGMWNDTATNWTLWCIAMLGKGVDPECCAYFVAHHADHEYLKTINVTCKSVGVLHNETLANFCELQTLTGRGTMKEVDMWDDIKGRVKKAVFYSTKASQFSDDEIRNAVRSVLEEELGEHTYEDPQIHWTRRWGYTKSGSHSRRIERELYGKTITKGERVNRRNFAESARENMIAKGTPMVLAGVSIKYEPGKERWIYGTDSVSYYTFDYLLTPIERAWKGRRVLLKPAEGGTLPKYRRWGSDLRNYKMMLDYDDFNSQHTNRAMQILYEEAFSRAPSRIRDWAVKSVDNEYVCFGTPEKRMRKVGTLFSGHRATSFVNSVLNAAYMRIVLGHDYQLLSSYHTGDDILFSTDDSKLVDQVIQKVMNSPIRANPQKQGLGTRNAEFLRCSFDSEGGIGYLARSISAFVCGNWTTENRLGSGDYVNAALQNLWTIQNRCGHQCVAVACLKALQRRTPILALPHVTFEIAIGGGPVRFTDYVKEICFTEIESKIETKNKNRSSDSEATCDYLNNHVDHKMLSEAGLSPGQLKKFMLDASYANTSTRDHQVIAHARSCVNSRPLITIGPWLKRSRGKLSTIFPLAQLKNQLSIAQLRTLLLVFYGEYSADPYREAWGEGTKSANFIGFLPYGDARYLCGATTLHCNFKIEYNLKL
jgi:hypothetical protein